MKKVHIISIDTPLLARLAIALKKRGYEITGSGVDFNEQEQLLLSEYELQPETIGWNAEKVVKELDWVVAPAYMSDENPEYKKAQETGKLILSFTDVVNHLAKNKIRVVIGGSQSQHRILSVMLYALRHYNVLCDFVALSDVVAQKDWIELGYDTRLILLEGYDVAVSKNGKQLLSLAYTPHIWVLPHLKWSASDEYPTLESYLKMLQRQLNGLERDGKFIYNSNITEFAEFAEQIREDVTAIPYKPHDCVEREGHNYLVTRYGEFEIALPDPEFLSDINAARLACRQFGLKDQDFYTALSEYCKL